MAAVVALLFVGVRTKAAVVVNIYAATAPNVYSSAPYPTWWANAQGAILSGAATAGTGDAQYIQLSSTGGVSKDLPGYDAITSGFDSWKDVAGGTGEYGHRMHFIYDIYDTTGADVSLANISGIDVLENGWGDTSFSIYSLPSIGGPFSFDSSTTWDPNKRVGYEYVGGAWVAGTSGTGTAQRIIGNFSMSYAAYYNPNYNADPTHQTPEYWQLLGDTPQDTLNHVIADIDANLQSWTGTLTYSGVSVRTTANFVPESSSLVLLLSGLGGLVAFRRRRKA